MDTITFAFTPPAAGSFFQLPCGEVKNAIENQIALRKPLNDLKKNQSAQDFFERFRKSCRDFWVAPEQRQMQCLYIDKAETLLDKSIEILQQVYDSAKNTNKKPSPEEQQAIYLQWNDESAKSENALDPKLCNNSKELQTLQDSLNSGGLIQQTETLGQLLALEIEKTPSTAERLIILALEALTSAGSVTGLWLYACSAGLIAVSGPLMVYGVPLIIGVTITLFSIATAYIQYRNNARMGDLLTLNEKVIGPFMSEQLAIKAKVDEIYRMSQESLQVNKQTLNNTEEVLQEVRGTRAVMSYFFNAMFSRGHSQHQPFGQNLTHASPRTIASSQNQPTPIIEELTDDQGPMDLDEGSSPQEIRTGRQQRQRHDSTTSMPSLSSISSGSSVGTLSPPPIHQNFFPSILPLDKGKQRADEESWHYNHPIRDRSPFSENGKDAPILLQDTFSSSFTPTSAQQASRPPVIIHPDEMALVDIDSSDSESEEIVNRLSPAQKAVYLQDKKGWQRRKRQAGIQALVQRKVEEERQKIMQKMQAAFNGA